MSSTEGLQQHILQPLDYPNLAYQRALYPRTAVTIYGVTGKAATLVGEIYIFDLFEIAIMDTLLFLFDLKVCVVMQHKFTCIVLINFFAINSPSKPLLCYYLGFQIFFALLLTLFVVIFVFFFNIGSSVEMVMY